VGEKEKVKRPKIRRDERAKGGNQKKMSYKLAGSKKTGL